MGEKKEPNSIQKSREIYGSVLAIFDVCSVLRDWILHVVCAHRRSMDSRYQPTLGSVAQSSNYGKSSR